jgi:hypothetical protein
MTFWWLQPGWTETCCSQCGAMIWPAGDPDWGVCFDCWTANYENQAGQTDPSGMPLLTMERKA